MKEMNLDLFERDLWVCTQCGYCKASCDIVHLKGWESLSPRGRIFLLKALKMGEIKLGKDQEKKFSDNVFLCTLCSRCKSTCPVDIDTRGLQMILRENLVNMGTYPEKIDLIKNSIKTERNVLSYPNDERAAFLEFLNDVPEDLYQKESADVIYFVGCMSSFSPAVQSIPEAFIEILKKAEVEFAIMGTEEWCCGFPLIVGGMKGKVEEVKKHNVEMVKKLGARTVVTTCPSCYNTWTRHYETDLEVLHSSQFIMRLLEEGRIKINKIEGKVAYHDPCDLGRNSGVYEKPRELIKATGLNVVNLAESRGRAFCCGGGGDLEAIDAKLANTIARKLAEVVESSGVDELVTACQQCKRMLMSAFKEKETKINVRDIVELVRDNVR